MVAEHPLRDITFVRDSPVARFAEHVRTLGGVSQSVGAVEELAIAVSQQARIYLADLPRLLRGEVDVMRLDTLAAQTRRRCRGTCMWPPQRRAASRPPAKALPALVENERRIVLDEGSRQLAPAMKALSAERELAIHTIIRALASERGELLRDVSSQRLLTLEWAAAERREAIAAVSGELARAIATPRGERAIALDEVRGIINMMLLRVAVFLIAGVVLAPLVAHAYVRVWPRR